MKKSSILLRVALFTGLFLPQFAAADSDVSTQNITLQVDGKALIKVTPGNNDGGSTTVKLSLAGANEAGAEVNPIAENDKTRLRISALAGLKADGVTMETRKVTAQNTGTSLSGTRTKLSIMFTEPNVNFTNRTEGGTLATDYKILSDTQNGNTGGAQTLVTAIGTCWSGVGDLDGYVIKYKYEATGGGTPTKKDGVVVTFTILAES
jgi:hypothetical protein